MKKAVILLNMGGADNLDQVEVFLKNMFRDKYILGIKNDFLRKFVAFLITKMRKNSAIKNYQKLGGKSPILDITKSLTNKLNSLSSEIIFDYAMNYTPPFCDEVLAKFVKFDEIVLLPLYPHYSQTTIKSSLEAALKSANKLQIQDKIKIIKPFYDDQIYNQIIVQNITNAVSGQNVSDIDLVFSAHSLPVSIINKGDPYEKHTNAQVEILREKLSILGFKSVSLAYQSRLGPVKWLGPNIAEVLPNLQSKKALIYPISFCIDNSETDFELAIFYKELAMECGFEYYKVVKAPNDSDEFARFLLNLVKFTAFGQ